MVVPRGHAHLQLPPAVLANAEVPAGQDRCCPRVCEADDTELADRGLIVVALAPQLGEAVDVLKGVLVAADEDLLLQQRALQLRSIRRPGHRLLQRKMHHRLDVLAIQGEHHRQHVRLFFLVLPEDLQGMPLQIDALRPLERHRVLARRVASRDARPRLRICRAVAQQIAARLLPAVEVNGELAWHLRRELAGQLPLVLRGPATSHMKRLLVPHEGVLHLLDVLAVRAHRHPRRRQRHAPAECGHAAPDRNHLLLRKREARLVSAAAMSHRSGRATYNGLPHDYCPPKGRRCDSSP
mmetsp:Transcript_57363/g.166567  ORF Transcript_57363/g.166567 Transcript_57363/m.166567 type:complete len:296 (+) Transcript_57363:213-1100(+)